MDWTHLRKCTKDDLIRLLMDQKPATPSEVATAARACIRSWSQEQFVVVGMDYRGRIIGAKAINVGNRHCVTNDPWTAFRYLVRIGAEAFYHVHNHPPGAGLRPSKDDKDLVKRYRKMGDVLHIELVGCLVISPTEEREFQ